MTPFKYSVLFRDPCRCFKPSFLVLVILVLEAGCNKSPATPVIAEPVKATLPAAEMDPAGLTVYRSSETTPSGWRAAIYQKRKFKEIETGAAKLLADHSRTSLDKLERFYDDLGALAADVDPSAQKAVLDAWVKESSSQVPWLVRGVFERNWAWAARGGGWAKNIPREAVDTFHGRMALAKPDLLKAASVNPRDPYAWAYLVSVGMALSVPLTEMDQYFQSAIALDSGNVLAYHSKLMYLLPQWFGSEKEMFEFAEEARQHSD